MEGKSLEPLTIELPLTERKCLINKQQQQKQKKHTHHPVLPEECTLLSPDGKLYTTPECSHVSWNYLPRNRKKKENQGEKENKKRIFILLNSVGRFLCVPSRQTKLSSFNSVTVPGFFCGGCLLAKFHFCPDHCCAIRTFSEGKFREEGGRVWLWRRGRREDKGTLLVNPNALAPAMRKPAPPSTQLLLVEDLVMRCV